jgi:hypothetical protein
MLVRKTITRSKVLSTKITPRDAQYLTMMVERYYEKGIIKQAKTSRLLRLIVKSFLTRNCPEYGRKTSTSYQQEMNKLYSSPKGDTIFPHSYLLQETNYSPGPSTANSTSAR